MYFSRIIVICLAICLPLVRVLPAAADTSQMAVSSRAVGTNEDTENTSTYMEKSPRQIRRRTFDFLHGAIDLTEEVVNRLAFGLFGIPPAPPRVVTPAPTPPSETPKL